MFQTNNVHHSEKVGKASPWINFPTILKKYWSRSFFGNANDGNQPLLSCWSSRGISEMKRLSVQTVAVEVLTEIDTAYHFHTLFFIAKSTHSCLLPFSFSLSHTLIRTLNFHGFNILSRTITSHSCGPCHSPTALAFGMWYFENIFHKFLLGSPIHNFIQ